MPKTLNRSIELQALLTQLNLGAMADGFADVALRAAKEGLSHEAYLYELARLETEQRTQRRTARLVRASGLPVEKTFRTLALSRLSPSLQLQLERLKNASFLETATNIIAIGKPGVGKSHCMAAIDRLVHHSVILDMMSVESYRAEVASLQHLSSDRPKKSSSKPNSLSAATTSSQEAGSHASISEPLPVAALLAEDNAESSH